MPIAADFEAPYAAVAVQSGSVGLADGLSVPGFVMGFTRNAEIFGEEEPADFVYKVVSGAVRTMRILSDGRRQVGAFHLPGDVFGIAVGAAHRFTAEAVCDCRLALVRRSLVEREAGRDASAARALWALATRDLERLQDHVVLLGRKSACERVAAFLLEMAGRTRGGEAVELPMSRIDIADYLGLTIETVSRTLTQLEKDRAIALPSCRRVVLRDRAALRTLDS